MATTFLSMNPKTLQDHITQVLPMSDEDLSLLISCAKGQELKKGATILKEGDLCRSFYFLETGYLRTWYNKGGTEINLNFTFEGDFTTNLKSYKSRQPSELNIEAGEDTVVWVLDMNLLLDKHLQHPQIAKFIRRLAINLLLASEEHSDLFKIYTPTERYKYIEKNRPELLQRVALSQLASYLGVARETLSRIRAKNHS